MHAQQDHTNYDEAKVGTYTFPQLLITQDGKTVRSAEQWIAQRRPEILELYRRNVHGRSPAGDATAMVATVVEEDAHALDGTARRKQIEIRFSDKPASPVLHVLLYTTATAKSPVPIFQTLHFRGNWEIIDDPGVWIYDVWDRKNQKKITPPTEVKRGTSQEWDVPLVLARGYGMAAIYYGDIEPDFVYEAGLPFGVRAMFRNPERTTRTPEEWGAIGAWSWGMNRVLDYPRTDKDVDGQRVAAVGQSRLGKTVLWTGAEDQRFAMIIASCSGEGGAALSLRNSWTT